MTLHSKAMLETLFGSRLRARVLAWLFTHPDQRYFVRQLTALIGEDSTNLSRELARLEKTGILVSATEGRQKYYQANRRSPVFDELHGLMLKTAGVADTLRKALEPRAGHIRLAFIFGSMAGRTENRLSDVDLLVVGDISFGDVVDLVSDAETVLNREVNPVVYTVAEFRRRSLEDHHFVRNILSGDMILLVGDENELRNPVPVAHSAVGGTRDSPSPETPPKTEYQRL